MLALNSQKGHGEGNSVNFALYFFVEVVISMTTVTNIPHCLREDRNYLNRNIVSYVLK